MYVSRPLPISLNSFVPFAKIDYANLRFVLVTDVFRVTAVRSVRSIILASGIYLPRDR